MAGKPDFLHPRAGQVNRSYIGANFCPGEQPLRDAYEALSADQQLRLNDARIAVQHGGSVENGLADIGMRRTQQALIQSCLSRIAAGQCLAYPEKHN